MLLKGADVESMMKDGNNALHIVTEERKRDCVRLLLASGSNTDVANFTTGDTPLHIAAAQGKLHDWGHPTTVNDCMQRIPVLQLSVSLGYWFPHKPTFDMYANGFCSN
ncbi:hypothetical protein QQ045_020521 [Rhodiola kirilowii]